MIVLDTESTGFLGNSLLPLAQQPYIIEFAARKLDDHTLKERDHISFLCNPGVPLPVEVVKTTGITDIMLADKEPFASHYEAVARFFLGEWKLVAHNLPHDVGMLDLELQRLGKQQQFPWPPHHLCTVELSQYFNGKYLKLTELYEELIGTVPQQEHRALADVDLLTACVGKLSQRGLL